MRTKGIICRGHARTIEDAADAWKLDHDTAMAVRDLEELLSLSLVLRDDLHEWFQRTGEALFAGRLENVHREGERLLDLCEMTLLAFEKLRRSIRLAQGTKYQVEHVPTFEQAVEDVRRLKANIQTKWPFIDPAQVERSREQFEQGRCRDAEDVLRELQGTTD